MIKPLTTVSPEDIPYIREDRIRKEIYNLENRKGALLRSSRSEKKSKAEAENTANSISFLETEICYLQRELEIRINRKKAHAEYLQKRSDKRARRSRNVV